MKQINIILEIVENKTKTYGITTILNLDEGFSRKVVEEYFRRSLEQMITDAKLGDKDAKTVC